MGIGGTPGRCNGFADIAISEKNNMDNIGTHRNFGFSSHYLMDAGCPFHRKGALDYLGSFSDALFCAVVHTFYESYISNNWTTISNNWTTGKTISAMSVETLRVLL